MANGNDGGNGNSGGRLPSVSQPLVSWMWNGLMGVFAIGFIAWAALVWNATDIVKRLDIEMTHVQADLVRMENKLENHQAISAHPKAAEMHAAQQRQLDDLQGQLVWRMSVLQDQINRMRDDEKRRRVE